MNSKVLMAFLVVGICSLSKSQAQFGISLNIGLQPVWGLVGYDRVDYYYLPDIGTYYNVPNRQYTYQVNGRWITSYSLPPEHRDYDLYAGHKVVMNGARPYDHDAINRARYANFKGRHDQGVIRDNKDSRYFANKDHPRHGEWKENGHDNRDKNNHGDKGEGHGNEGEGHGNRGEGHGNGGGNDHGKGRD